MAKLIDLSGQKFDKLLVLEKAPSRARHVYWRCQCDCGNIVEVSGESLRRNIPHNCGCVKQKAKNEAEQLKQQKLNYLVGKTFGKLTVIDRTDERINNSIVWKCKCECGNYKNVPTHLLQSCHTQSCGCLAKAIKSKDITGQRFGKLIAIKPIEEKKRSTLQWLCQCDCGRRCIVDGSFLRRGLTQSCGCITSSIGELNIQNILQENNIEYKKEYTIKEIGNLRFDFALLKNNKVIRLIEFDGIQHFSSRTGVWNDTKEDLGKRQKRDQIKNEYALSHNIPLVRIPYWERDKITLDMIMGEQYEVRKPVQPTV